MGSKNKTIKPTVPGGLTSTLISDISSAAAAEGMHNAGTAAIYSSEGGNYSNLYKFQSALQSYMWGNTGNARSIDLTSQSGMRDIMRRVKPMLLRNDSHSGVTISIKLNTKERDKLESMMNAYARVSTQSSSMIYQHSLISTSSLSSVKSVAYSPGEKQRFLIAELNKSEVITRKYSGMVSKLSDLTDGSIEAKAAEDSAAAAENSDSDSKPVHAIYIKLYPATCNIGYPTTRLSVAKLSNSRLLPVVSGVANPALRLQGILAFNTEDTQWFDIYASFFNLWVQDFGNRPVTVTIGPYTFKKLMLSTAPVFINNYRNVESFSLVLTSETTSLGEFVG